MTGTELGLIALAVTTATITVVVVATVFLVASHIMWWIFRGRMVFILVLNATTLDVPPQLFPPPCASPSRPSHVPHCIPHKNSSPTAWNSDPLSHDPLESVFFFPLELIQMRGILREPSDHSLSRTFSAPQQPPEMGIISPTWQVEKLRHRGAPPCPRSLWYSQAARHCRHMRFAPFPSAFTAAKMPSSSTSLLQLMTRADLLKEIETNFADP